MSIYTDNGFESRKDYLTNLADEYGIDVTTVFEIASILGPNEDFDGLINSLEDYEAFDDNEIDEWSLMYD